MSGGRVSNPETLPPGVTKPVPAGSVAEATTIGMVCVALLTASVVGTVEVTITSTGSWTSSVARWPSTHPCSRNPSRSWAMNGSDVSGKPPLTTPMRLGWVVCCAEARMAYARSTNAKTLVHVLGFIPPLL